MKKLAIILLLMTASCAHQYQPVKTEYKVVVPDSALLECERVTSYPNPDTLKDSDVATLLNEYKAKNDKCFNNMDALKLFFKTAKKIIED